MATTTTTTVSAWAKPGSWSIDSEAQEEEDLKTAHQYQIPNNNNSSNSSSTNVLSDFPSLSAAAATKSKKKKPQAISWAEFATGKSVTHGSAKSAAKTAASKGLTHEESLTLPTGPRERSAEELERSRLGGGFRSYGLGDGGRGSGSRVSEERRSGGFNREPAPPSRADEIDDWGAAKKSFAAAGAPGYERRERRESGFFESQHSRADEADNWLAKKSFGGSGGGGGQSEPPRRFGSGGFESGRERRGGGFEGYQKEGSDGGDSDSWLKKRDEGSSNGGGRPRLVLQPRTLPVDNVEQQLGLNSAGKSKGSNPFGEARPREEVLAEKGQDWKKIDEQLESVKIKEGGSGDGPASSWKKGFGAGNGNGRASVNEDRSGGSWRKALLPGEDAPPADSAPSSEEKINEDNGEVEK
ncbi:hypothetical protein Scep_000367 [Stephania cephalantha]|uniref:Eukaryotic translation initiation factor 4B3-like n=1 Tax=Stephania cephalantha TaxID=152367 RepID=A0AAP0Q6L7_9MAGN